MSTYIPVDETWSIVEGYSNYAVSNFGRLLNVKFDRELIPTPCRRGYYRVALYDQGVRKDYYVHRLVASIFLPEFDADYEIAHKNGIRSDNGILNLEVTEYLVGGPGSAN